MAAMVALEADTSPSRGRGQAAGSRVQASSSRGEQAHIVTPRPTATTPMSTAASAKSTAATASKKAQSSTGEALHTSEGPAALHTRLHTSRQKKRPKSMMGRMLG